MSTAGAIFEPDGAGFMPTEHAIGPWDSRALHGGAPATLLGRAIENHEPEPGMPVVRFTMELLRPVPLARLTATTETIRPGRKVQLVEACLFAGDSPVARVRALRMRRQPLALPPTVPDPEPPPPGPDTGELLPDAEWKGFISSLEKRVVKGTPFQGATTIWFRLRRPVIAGEEPSPLVRVLAAADFGNGISNVLGFRDYIFINADLTVHLFRQPAGEWVCLDAVSSVDGGGTGMAESALHDEAGRLGRSVQSLLLEARAEQ